MNIDIDSIKRKLLVKYPFFGSIVANSKFIADLSISTAQTDGEDIYYSPNFLKELTEDEQIFIFAHEVCHIAFDHIFRSEGKDKRLWNIATDSVINAFLKQDGLSLPIGGVDIPEAINYDAEEMYKKLLEEKQQSQNQQNKQENSNNQEGQKNQNSQTNSQNNNTQSNSSNTNNDDSNNNNEEESQNVGHDNHHLWEKAIERKKQKDNESKKESNEQNIEEGKKESLFDKLFKRNNNKQSEKEEKHKTEQDEEQKNKEKEIKKLTDLGEKNSFKQNKIERKKQLEELRKSLAEQSHNASKGTNRDIRDVGEIGIAAPLIDWRRLLKEAVQYNIDWSYKNASIEDGVVTPYLEQIPYPETEILLDTSGSIDQTLLRNFLRECKNILQTSKVKVGCFDDKFYGFAEMKNEKDIDNMIFRGGGGTNFDVAVNAFSRRVENKIIFTDGCADMPDKSVDAIWIVFGDKKISPKGGKVIYISEEQLEKLCSYMINSSYKGRKR